MDPLGYLDGLAGLGAADAEGLAASLGPGPLLRVRLDPRGHPAAATCLLRVGAPPARLWRRIRDLDGLPKLVEMMEAVDRLPPLADGGEQVRVRLRFHLAFLSVRFHFTARVTRQEGRWLQLTFLEGKVRDVLIRLETTPLGADGCLLRTHIAFDPRSLGWLLNVFLRHHPEIEWGVHAGAALCVAQAARALAEPPETV
ncbi:MAG TPA: SRPBCC family protein [Myxococcota bacterium]|nr:SRPBCC family protein [Myxococcota bacterium]HRY91816.1 SRPBCC family protein [Myxococcota bacterium]HSA23087.1 SRPBCC family protein [Myxococcota bacterium]